MKLVRPAPLLLVVATAGCAAAPGAGGAVLAPGSPAAFGETVAVGTLAVTPLALVEDSRCPQGVACVWAGRVVISARIAGRGAASTRKLTLGDPVGVAGGTLALATVTPPRRVGEEIAANAYRFTFRISVGG